MLERGAARHSTAPGPGPRAGRCATPPPQTASTRCDPGPIVGSLHRLGWGDAHDASRGWQRRRHCRPWCPSTGILRPDAMRVQLPGPACCSGAGHVQFKSPREVVPAASKWCDSCGGGIAGRRMLKKRTRTSGWHCRLRRYPCSSPQAHPPTGDGAGRRRWPSHRSSAAPSLCVVKTIQASLAEPEPFGNRCRHSP